MTTLQGTDSLPQYCLPLHTYRPLSPRSIDIRLQWKTLFNEVAVLHYYHSPSACHVLQWTCGETINGVQGRRTVSPTNFTHQYLQESIAHVVHSLYPLRLREFLLDVTEAWDESCARRVLSEVHHLQNTHQLLDVDQEELAHAQKKRRLGV